MIRNPSSLVLSTALLTAVLGTGACKSEPESKPTAQAAQAVNETPKPAVEPAKATEARTLTLDAKNSSVGFVASKVTASHTGSFGELGGKVELRGNTPVKLSVVIKLASVTADAEKLTGHLKSKDFFEVEKFATSQFTSSSFTPLKEGGTHNVTGELDLHGVKKQVSFPATLSVQGNTATGKAELKVNRKDFGIEYPGMRDDLIRDEVIIKLDLKFGGS